MSSTSPLPHIDRKQLTLDTIAGKPSKHIPIWQINPMEWTIIDRLAAVPEGSYELDPHATYNKMLDHSGVCMVDQILHENPLSMRDQGYTEHTARGATTGAAEIVCDGIRIEEPEDVIEHMESVVFPRLDSYIQSFDENRASANILSNQTKGQQDLPEHILKTPHAIACFPGFNYGQYGYENYFMAYALYPEVMEKFFSLVADHATLYNRACARAIKEGNLAPYIRLDHDMADSRGTLVDIKSLDAIWFPHFARCIQPLKDAGVRMIWHCDGNLMQMVPRLLDCGLEGFQGFQYEDGMDYEQICKMKTKDGNDLLIIAGVSVTTTLPHGTPADVRKEMKWLVENGPRQGLFLGGSSSIAPGVSWENMKALVEGFLYYLENGRS